MDAVQKANSGHPGAPMGMADIAEVLWRDFLKHNPNNPKFADRDRFVLSNGHGSMLIYSLLHLTGYDLSIDDLKTSVSCTASTPVTRNTVTPQALKPPPARWARASPTPSVSPLPKSAGRAVQPRRPPIVDHFTYAFLGDGCMMEGISHEVCSLAGTLGLGKAGCLLRRQRHLHRRRSEGWFTDDTPARFEAYGWQVIPQCRRSRCRRNQDGHRTAVKERRPSDLICCKTTIGLARQTKAAKKIATVRHWARRNRPDPRHPGLEPRPVRNSGRYLRRVGRQTSRRAAEAEWDQRFAAMPPFPELAAEFKRPYQR